jgi:membrane protease subunit (stomatin/prohibitin family)
MALIDIVKMPSNDEDFIMKFPSENLRLGTQVVVNNGQVAFFVKGGKLLDEFKPGTHTLHTDNIPILNKLINLPFGGETPFQAEVWYVNMISKLDLKWGTPNAIQLEDPKYGVIIPVRAYGQYGFKISNARTFLETLVGDLDSFNADKIFDYFRGKVLATLTTLMTTKLVKENISVLEINAYLDDLSDDALEKTNEEFIKYGIEIVNFYFISVNIPEDDPSIIKLKEAKDLAAKVKIIGRDIYQMDRSFDVLDKAAENEGTVGSSFIGAGIGLGIGSGLGNQMGGIASNMNTSSPPPFTSNEKLETKDYHVYKGKERVGPFSKNELIEKLKSSEIDQDTFTWKIGMKNWQKISNFSEFSLFLIPPPPPNL